MPGLSTIKLYAWLAGLGAIAALALGLWLYVGGLRTEAASLRSQLSDAEAAADLATAQTAVTTTAAKAADDASTKEVHITVTSEQAAHAVEQAQGAGDALPPDVLGRWRAGVLGGRAQTAPAAPGSPGGGEPAGAVSAPQR